MQPTCSGPDCDRDIHAAGLCNAHYWQKRKGLPLGPVKPVYTRGRSMQERLDELTDKSGDCWEWLGAKSELGYGVVNRGTRGRTIPAHRAAFMEANGPIPDGHFIDHMCHNPSCVNPSHLQSVTPGGNNENRKGANKNNKSSGIRGVSWHQNRWVAQVTHNRKNHHGGRFKTIEEAHAAVVALRMKLHTNNLKDRE